MHHPSCCQIFRGSLILQDTCELPSPIIACHGNSTLPCWRDEGVMFLLHASTSVSLVLLIIHISSFLLIKLFTSLNKKAASQRVVELQSPHDECHEREDLIADVILGGGLRFLYNESCSNETQLAKRGIDSKEQICSKVEDTLVSESSYGSPLEDPNEEKLGIEYSEVAVTDVPTPTSCPSPIISPCVNVNIEEEKSNDVEVYENKEKKDFSEDEKIFLIDHSHLQSKSVQLEDSHEDKENFGGSLTGESTSKSSIEWRSSTVFRDSETEYPFSSSSRRSSSNWESYTVFRKYVEEMMFLERVSAEKLTQTESLRSLQFQPRSMSQRMVHRLTTKHKKFSQRARDPYQELEGTYVAQICLTWEALNWNYNNFKRLYTDRCIEDSSCPAHIAQQFQQFQVLLQRFIENEPYERGRRPEVFARVRNSSPKLLRVPEFHESVDDEGSKGTSSKISSAEFLGILEGAIRTFMDFLKADRETPCQKFRSFVKNARSVDPTFHHLLKKVNKKKKLRLKDLVRRQKCLVRRKLEDKKESEILMGLIDMKVVSRALRMPEINEEQLHWCEEKMAKVRVWDGKLHRDSSSLFFPAHGPHCGAV